MKKHRIKEIGVIFEEIKTISDEDYQIKIWVNHEDPDIVDSYDDTMMYFLEETYEVLKDGTNVIISDREYQMLKKLYEMVDAYDDLKDRPETDKGIVNDPRWDEVRRYAKSVYAAFLPQ